MNSVLIIVIIAGLMVILPLLLVVILNKPPRKRQYRTRIPHWTNSKLTIEMPKGSDTKSVEAFISATLTAINNEITKEFKKHGISSEPEKGKAKS